MEWRRCPPHHHQQPLQLQSSEFLEFFRLYLQRLLVLGLSIEISYHRVWRHVLPGPCAPAGSISAAGAISSIIARMLYSLTLSGIIATSLALGLLGCSGRMLWLAQHADCSLRMLALRCSSSAASPASSRGCSTRWRSPASSLPRGRSVCSAAPAACCGWLCTLTALSRMLALRCSSSAA